MSISGIASSLFNYVQNVQTQRQQFHNEFKQLGQDLQSGNITAAQSDFEALEQLRPLSTSASEGSPASQTLNQLSQDLKSGNLSGAQQDYQTLQHDLLIAHARHHHLGSVNGEISQLFAQRNDSSSSSNQNSSVSVTA